LHGEDLVADLGGGHDVRAVLGVEDEEAGISNSGTPVLTLQGTYRAPQAWIDVLDGIAHDRWPEGPTRLGHLKPDPVGQQLRVIRRRQLAQTRPSDRRQWC
jgi:hypothetical protein